MNQGDRVKVLYGFFAGKIGTVHRANHVFSAYQAHYGTSSYLVRFENGREVEFKGKSCLRVLTPLEWLAEAAE